ncbi:hypothetical protein BHAP_0928 [Bifidobacterium hapali]|uniref:Uncharacterized protein n=1 Tax=Bifidobacterium hapali TaxID=1630172 RepID=A0A261FZY9_9BIFI|nr:hypothetical protein BHAP_0928 [Bifidobacterium hapali]
MAMRMSWRLARKPASSLSYFPGPCGSSWAARPASGINTARKPISHRDSRPCNMYGTQVTWIAAAQVWRFLHAENNIGLHCREDGHELRYDDWETILNFTLEYTPNDHTHWKTSITTIRHWNATSKYQTLGTNQPIWHNSADRTPKYPYENPSRPPSLTKYHNLVSPCRSYSNKGPTELRHTLTKVRHTPTELRHFRPCCVAASSVPRIILLRIMRP